MECVVIIGKLTSVLLAISPNPFSSASFLTAVFVIDPENNDKTLEIFDQYIYFFKIRNLYREQKLQLLSSTKAFDRL